jgi:hypothetical protein
MCRRQGKYSGGVMMDADGWFMSLVAIIMIVFLVLLLILQVL